MAQKLSVDLHVHTSRSKDSRASPESVVSKAITLGLDAIAVTDHNTVQGSLDAEKAASGTSLLVIPGQEVETGQGEIVVLNLRETLPPGRPLKETLSLARKKGGFIIIPHPFDLMRKGIGQSMAGILESIDAVEVFNARTIFGRFNSRAMEFAERHSLPKTAGSDSHFLSEMGRSYTTVRSAKAAEQILDAIKSGKTELVMRRQTRASRLRRGLLKIRTYF